MVFPAAEAAVTAAVERIAGEAGLRIEPGKLVLELRPPTNVDEGIALARLMADHELRTIVYVGDDRGDIPAMRLTISAGGHALLVDDGVESFQAWLSALARRLEEAHSPSHAR